MLDPHDNLAWSEKYRLAGEDWADKEAAAQILEDLKSAMMSQWQTELGDIPVNRAEQIVKASARWKEYIADAVEARRAANIAKIHKEVVKMKAMEQHAAEANQRTELKVLGR